MNIYTIKPLFNISWVIKAYREQHLPLIKNLTILTDGIIVETTLTEEELLMKISPYLQGEIIIETVQEME